MGFRSGKVVAAVGILFSFGAISGAAFADATAERVRSTVDKAGSAMVMIKGVLNLEMQGQKQEVKIEIPATVVDGAGLVVAMSIKNRMSVAKMTIEGAKIVLPDGKECDAKEEGNDDDHSLAFFRIESPKDAKESPAKGLKPLDLAPKGKLAMGDDLLVIRRHSAMHLEPVVVEDRVSSVLAKPKTLFLLSGGHPAGCLVANGEGTPVGITAIFQETTPDGQNRQMLIVLPLDQIAEEIKNLAAAGEKKE